MDGDLLALSAIGGCRAARSRMKRAAGFVGTIATAVVWIALGLLQGDPCAAAATMSLTAPALPDGRVYEQVSPVDKNGANASGKLGLVRAGLNGDSLMFFSEPTLPGSEGASQFGTYLSTREEQNWSTLGLLPAAPQEGAVEAVSADLAFSYVAVEDATGQGAVLSSRENGTRLLRPIAHVPNLEAVQAVATTSDDSSLLFESSVQLTPEASAEHNVYLWDSRTDAITLASVMNSGGAPSAGGFAGPYDWPDGNTFGGGPAAQLYSPGALTEDGTAAYFTTSGQAQLYLRRNITSAQSMLSPGEECEEATKGCTIQVSASQDSVPDPNGEKPAAFLSATSGGPSVAFFASAGKLTDNATTGPTGEGLDLYRYEAVNGQLEDLVPDPTDPNGAEVRGFLGANKEGTRAYFIANGVLGDGARKGATRGECTLPPDFTHQFGSGTCNLYMWEKGGGITFVAQLNAEGSAFSGRFGEPPTSDASDWMIGPGNGVQPTAWVSGDGGTLVFRSQETLTAYANDRTPEFYRYQAAGRSLSCVSCAPSGVKAMAQPTAFSIESFAFVSLFPLYHTRNLSENGQRFYFQTAEALVPEDTNGESGCPTVRQPVSIVPRCQDVYEWEASGEGTCTEGSGDFSIQAGGCIYLLSSGKSSDPSYFGDADPSGNNAFLYTSQALVAQDKDQLVDIYDARVGGGLAAQTQLTVSPCDSSSECRAPVSGESGGSTADSASAPVHPAPKRLRCGSGLRKVKQHGKQRCLKVARGKPRGKKRHHRREHHSGTSKAHSGSNGGKR
jgi:hypothetical protein